MSKKIPLSCPSGKDKTITFHRFPHHIWHDHNYSLHERVILCRVWSFQNSTPPLECYLSFEQWAQELACTRRHAINVLNRLVEKNQLVKESRGLQTNIWRLVNTVHYQTVDSEYSSLSIVNTVHHNSEYSSLSIVNTVHPRRSLEDHKEDHLEDQVVADAPLPTETELKNSLIDLEPVKEPVDTLAEPEPSDVTHPPRDSAPPLPKKKKARIKEPQSLCPAPSVWLTPERMEKLKANAREVPQWAELSDPNLETAIRNLSYEMHTWSEGKGIKRPGWELTFKKWLPNNAPRFFEDKQSTEATKRDKARSLFDRLVTAASDGPQFHGAFQKLPTLAMLYDSDEAITNYREQLKPLKKGTKDYEMTEAVFVKRFLDKALQCQK